MSTEISSNNQGPYSYCSRSSARPLIGNTLPNVFDETAAKFPKKDALVFYSQDGSRDAITYEKLRADSVNLAAAMLQMGCTKGDLIGTMLKDSINNYITRLALHRIGANVCLMSDDMKANQSQVNRFGCVGVVIETDQDFDNHQRSLLTTWSSTLKFVVCTRNINLQETHILADCIDKGRLLDKDPVSIAQKKVDMDDDAFIILTSGSTGVPKRVQYSHFGAINASKSFMENICLDSTSVLFNDRLTRVLSGTLQGVISCWLGIPIVSMPSTMYWHHKDTYIHLLLDILNKEHITHVVLMQHHMHDVINLLRREVLTFTHLQYILTGGQPMPPELYHYMQTVMPKAVVLQIYGTSEAMVSGESPHDMKEEKYEGSVGIIFPWVEIKIIDDNSSVVPMGSQGEICVRGPHTFKEYHGDRELTAKIVRNGWFHTGDIGFLQPGGHVTILGRKSDVLIFGGLNVFPCSVESIISKYEGIKQAIVVGVADARMGQAVCACVLPKENFIEKDFISWCEKTFGNALEARASIPKYTCIMSEFPLVGLGKVDRKAVKLFAMKQLNMLE